jgi:hypothetical protein
MTNPPYYGPPQPSPWPPPPPGRRGCRILAFVGIFIAVGLAIGGWFRPAAQDAASVHAAPQYSGQQVADAKKAVRAARDKTTKAVAGAGSQRRDDPTEKSIIMVNMRLAFDMMTEYLRSQLATNPAAPPAITTAFRNSISTYDDMVLTQLANAPNEELDPVYAATTAADDAIVQACE